MINQFVYFEAPGEPSLFARVSEIREMGRATQGVTLIGLDEGAKLSGMQRIVENDAQAGTEDDGADAPAADDDTP